ncbi:MAG: IclR family transcriptional regulator [Chloroflexota bacterium]|nr:IclR family transcriptional regulator [Chloroflexota bacterium]
MPARGGSNSTAERTIDVLLLFDEDHPQLTAGDVSERLKMPRSTTYRYLQSLRSYELIEEENGSGRFRLGARLLQLARVARKGMGIADVAFPDMQALAARTGEAVLLTRISGDRVVCLERVESQHRISLSYERGHVLPLHAGASAKVLLAFLPEPEIEAILERVTLNRYTDRTVTDKPTLRRQLADIRVAGYAVTNGEVDEGVRGVAAPIFGPEGRVAAGLSIAGPSFRLVDDTLPDAICAVQEAAKAVGKRLERLDG